LKPPENVGVAIELKVAPRRGAWIETVLPKTSSQVVSSHPAGVRGLKLGQNDKR